jgi:hypothetical protein
MTTYTRMDKPNHRLYVVIATPFWQGLGGAGRLAPGAVRHRQRAAAGGRRRSSRPGPGSGGGSRGQPPFWQCNSSSQVLSTSAVRALELLLPIMTQ